MFDSHFITILFDVGVVKLFAIVTSNFLDLDIKLILGILANFLNIDATSALSCKKNVQVYREKSSTMTKQYLLPPKLAYVVSPNKSIWSSSSTLEVER